MSQIDRVIKAAAPEFRKAIETLFSEKRYAHAFNVADGLNTQTGIQTQVVCYLVVLPTTQVASFETQLSELILASFQQIAATPQSTGEDNQSQEPQP